MTPNKMFGTGLFAPPGPDDVMPDAEQQAWFDQTLRGKIVAYYREADKLPEPLRTLIGEDIARMGERDFAATEAE